MLARTKLSLVAAVFAISAAFSVPASAALKVDYKKGSDAEVTFKTEWTKKEFVKAVKRYLKKNSFDDLASYFAAKVDPSKNYDPFSSSTFLDAKYGSDLKLIFKDKKNVFVVWRGKQRLYRFNGPDDAVIPVPGPEAGAGLAGLAMAGVGAYMVRRRRQETAATA